jgi:hypothetical protein
LLEVAKSKNKDWCYEFIITERTFAFDLGNRAEEGLKIVYLA